MVFCLKLGFDAFRANDIFNLHFIDSLRMETCARPKVGKALLSPFRNIFQAAAELGI